MESNNDNNQLLFLSEFKELRNELSAMKKRIVQLEKFQEKQQDSIDDLERENHVLKTELNNLNLNGSKKERGSFLKRKRIDQDQEEVHEEEIESKTTSVSAGKEKKTKTNNDNDEAVVMSRCDNRDSFDSLSDDLLLKIVKFDGNCYAKFGLINKRCKNIYDVEVYKLKKQTCLYGYGTLDMMLERYLQRRKEGELDIDEKICSAGGVIIYNRLDAIDWMTQLGDNEFFKGLYSCAAYFGRIDILLKILTKCNLTMLDDLLNDTILCYFAAAKGKLKTLKWLRNLGAKWDAETFTVARDEGYDEIVQYLCLEGCPEPPEIIGR